MMRMSRVWDRWQLRRERRVTEQGSWDDVAMLQV